jgi:hypothetical protein
MDRRIKSGDGRRKNVTLPGNPRMNPDLMWNVLAFLAFPQWRGAVSTAGANSGARTAVERRDVTIFLGILTHSSRRLLLNA